MKAFSKLLYYKVVGRCLPTPSATHHPSTACASARSHVVAKSRFWYFVSQLNNMKESSGEIVNCGQQVFKKSPLRVKNFGIWLHCNSRSGTHNTHREYRNLTTTGTVTQCYQHMGAWHRAHAHSIQIMKVEEIAASKCHYPAVK
ncbi:60S ribosomal protein L18a-like [Pipistrellus kuhlii]|uniref:60S ribosomal protein L18a-like n=1 Tax=Pipistrellus kuhlii TaxID=59472 RepID=UPI00174F6A42|nr:60S ribosomal protein L18a-like [Pipistrellus kuhlii]